MLNTLQLPAEWSTLKKLIWLRGSPASGGMGSETLSLTAFSAPTLKTVTKKSKVTSCEVAFEPSQDLHGYDAPWPAGGGKNIANPANVLHGYYSVQNPSNFVANEAYRTLKQTLGAGTYTFTSDLTNLRILRWAIGNTSTQTNYDPPLTFTIESEGVVQICFRNKDTTDITEDFNVQLEAGSTASSFAPYSNICPISGWQGATVNVCGVNHLKTYTVNAIATQYNHCLCGKIDNFSPSTTYTIAFTGAEGHKFYPNENTFTSSSEIVATGGAQYVTLTTKSTIPSNQYNESAGGWILFKNRPGNTVVPAFTDVAVNNPSSVTTYTPYQGATATIQFGDTYYGGTADTVTGVGTITWASVDIGSLEWGNRNNTANYDAFVVTVPELKPAGSGSAVYKGISSALKPTSYNATWHPWEIAPNTTNGFGTRVIVPHNLYDSTSAAKQAFVGVQLVYELETPTPYTFPPASEQLTLAKGTNNAWAEMTTGD